MTFVNTEHLLLAAGTYSPPNIIDFLLREGSIYGDVIMPKTTLVMMVVAIDADDLFYCNCFESFLYAAKFPPRETMMAVLDSGDDDDISR